MAGEPPDHDGDRAVLEALIAPLRPHIDQAQHRLGPWLRQYASATMVREALEQLAIDVLRHDRLRRGSGPVPETDGSVGPGTPVHKPRPAIEWPYTGDASGPRRRPVR